MITGLRDRERPPRSVSRVGDLLYSRERDRRRAPQAGDTERDELRWAVRMGLTITIGGLGVPRAIGGAGWYWERTGETENERPRPSITIIGL